MLVPRPGWEPEGSPEEGRDAALTSAARQRAVPGQARRPTAIKQGQLGTVTRETKQGPHA